MALKNQDTTPLGNRLNLLMDENGFGSPRELAKEFYGKNLVHVNSRSKDEHPDSSGDSDSLSFDDKYAPGKAIDSIEKKIVRHINHGKITDNSGDYINAYCSALNCSADYLLGITDIKSPDMEIRRICEITGLSEQAVKNLRDSLNEIGTSLLFHDFWSELLGSESFYELASEWNTANSEYFGMFDCLAIMNAIGDVLKDEDPTSFHYIQISEYAKTASKEADHHSVSYTGTLYKISTMIMTMLSERLEQNNEEYYENRYEEERKLYQKMVDKLKQGSSPKNDDDDFKFHKNSLPRFSKQK